jgi:putative ABC transport system substrate-binding protein
MSSVGDPVGNGLIASLAHPGGNVTGMSIQSTDLAGKDFQLVRELRPTATRVALLTSTTDTPFVGQIQAMMKRTGITLVVQRVRTGEGVAGAFAAMQRAHVQALIVQSVPPTSEHRQQIVELAAQYHLPAIYGNRAPVDLGGLMSYGPNFPEIYRRTAYYVDRILKGAKPANLPVEQPTKFELVINLKTAKALGIKIPQSLLVRADKIIE